MAPGTPHHVGMVGSEEARKRFSEVQSLSQIMNHGSKCSPNFQIETWESSAIPSPGDKKFAQGDGAD